MPARLHFFRYHKTKATQILLCLVFLSLLCRAIIPAGFMPGIGNADGKPFSITFCTTGTISTQSLLPKIVPDQPAPDGQHIDQHNCVFGTLVTLAALVHNTASSPNDQSPKQQTIRLRHNHTLAAMFVPGPPLGSHAPPPASPV